MSRADKLLESSTDHYWTFSVFCVPDLEKKLKALASHNLVHTESYHIGGDLSTMLMFCYKTEQDCVKALRACSSSQPDSDHGVKLRVQNPSPPDKDKRQNNSHWMD